MVGRVASLLWLPVVPVALVGWTYRNGGQSIVRQHDELDGYRALFNQMSMGDLFASPGTSLPYMLGGLERHFVGSELHFGNLIAVIFPIVWAMMISELIIRLVAFFGMRALIEALGVRPMIAYFTATLFALLPFYLPVFGAISAIPAVLFGFYRVWRDRRVDRRSVVGIIVFPFFVEFPFGVSLLIVLVGLVVALCITWRVRHNNWAPVKPLSIALGALAATSALGGWRVLYAMLAAPPSHRSDMVGPRAWESGVWENVAADVAVENTHWLVGKSSALALLILIGIVLFILRPSGLDWRQRWIMAVSIVGIVAGVVFSRAWPLFEAYVVASVLDGWGRLQLNRVRWVEPTLLAVLAALSAEQIALAIERFSLVRRVPVVLAGLVFIALQASHTLSLHQFRANPDTFTIAEYYAEGTFAEVRSVIGTADDVRTVSLGFHPAVAIFNGFHAADGYWNGYPIEYKARFRTLIAPSLDNDPADRAYFDNWGSRVQLFQAPLGRPPSSGQPRTTPLDLIVDSEAFGVLGITHLISTAEVLNVSEVGLATPVAIDTGERFGKVYVYEVLITTQASG